MYQARELLTQAVTLMPDGYTEVFNMGKFMECVTPSPPLCCVVGVSIAVGVPDVGPGCLLHVCVCCRVYEKDYSAAIMYLERAQALRPSQKVVRRLCALVRTHTGDAGTYTPRVSMHRRMSSGGTPLLTA